MLSPYYAMLSNKDCDTADFCPVFSNHYSPRNCHFSETLCLVEFVLLQYTVQHHVPMNKHDRKKVQQCESACDLILLLRYQTNEKLAAHLRRHHTALLCKAG